MPISSRKYLQELVRDSKVLTILLNSVIFLMIMIARRTTGGMAEWFKAAVLKTAVPRGTVGSNPTPSASRFEKSKRFIPGEIAELAEGARLLSECRV